MNELEKSFKEKFGKELPIDFVPYYPTHIPIKEMMNLVVNASMKEGFDSYLALKHFQFTDKEIKEYFETSNQN